MDIAEFHLLRAPGEPPADRLIHLPKADPGAAVPPSPDPLAELGDTTDSSVLERLFSAVQTLELRLRAANDQVSGADLEKLAARELITLNLDSVDWLAEPLPYPVDGPLPKLTPWNFARLGLRMPLLDALRSDGEGLDRALRLTRMVVVADLLSQPDLGKPTLTPAAVLDLLQRRTVVLDGLKAEELHPAARIQLVREARVADLQVVRREWAGYLAGEVANIRNVLAGETFEQREESLRETETTTEKQTQAESETQSETQSKLQSELSTEINTELGITVNGYAHAQAEFKYPIITAQVSAGIDAGLSLQRSERQATKIAREAVSRAASRINSSTKESRARRELVQNKLGTTYSVANPGPKNQHGIYRWVDRVDTYQLFRYPDRLLLEFQIPEPAEFYRWRTAQAANTRQGVDKPPDWTVTAAGITAIDLVKLAREYRASNLPPAPDAQVSVARTLLVEPTTKPASPKEVEWNPPTAAKELDIALPTDYAAVSVSYEGEGFPCLASWGDGRDPAAKAFNHGYRSAFAAVAVGSTSTLYWNGGADPNVPGRFLATFGSQTDPGVVREFQEGRVPYGRALLPIGSDSAIDPGGPATVDITPPAINTLKVALSTVGLLGCAVTFSVTCELTGEAWSAWQLSVYDALFSAWTQWKGDYDAAQVRQGLINIQTADVGGSARGDQIIRDELRREVVSWLLDEPHFRGRPGLDTPAATVPPTPPKPPDFRDVLVSQALLDAPIIQFLEQSFEWSNLSWIFYPYYWADGKIWTKLTAIDATDPEFERFLRAGSARVVLSVRPGFEDAVRNWLLLGVPFISGQLPSPDDKLYLRIDQEIRDLTAPVDGGIAGASWQSLVSTTMLYLETDADLPLTNIRHRLPAPRNVPYVPGPIVTLP